MHKNISCTCIRANESVKQLSLSPFCKHPMVLYYVVYQFNVIFLLYAFGVLTVVWDNFPHSFWNLQLFIVADWCWTGSTTYHNWKASAKAWNFSQWELKLMVSCSLIHKTVKMVVLFVYENLGKTWKRKSNIKCAVDTSY